MDCRSKSIFTPFRKLSSYVPMNANVMKTNAGKLLVAVLAMFMITAGAAIVLSDNVNAEGDSTADQAVASIDNQYYSSLDLAIKDAISGTSETPTEIKLLKDTNLKSESGDYKLQNVIIAADNKVTLTLNSPVWIEGTVGFENIEFAADGPDSMLIYTGYGGSIDFSLTKVSFDESVTIDGGPLTVYTDKDSKVTIADSDFTNTRLVYSEENSKTPSMTITNSTNVDMNITATSVVTLGEDIKIEGNSTIGNVLLARGVEFTVPDNTTFTANSIGIYEGSTGSIVTDNLDSITADIANSYNRECFAVPGRVGDGCSEGCNRLIHDNKAALLLSADDLMKAMMWEGRDVQTVPGNVQRSLFPELSEEEASVVRILMERGELHINTLVVASNIPVNRMSALLFELEMKGVVKALAGSMYRLV